MNITNIQFKKCRAKIGMFGLLLVVMLAQGCASSGTSNTVKSATSEFAMPSPGKTKVIFVRPTSNGHVDLGVHDGERLVAKLSGKTYGVYECEPGQHLFSGSFGNLYILNANLLPDRIYYVKAVLIDQMWTSAFVKMTPLYPGAAGSDWEKMPRILTKLKKSVVTPEQAERDKKGIDRYMERLKVYRDKPGSDLESILPEYGQTTSLYPQ
jgi:hypothetical protein